MPLTLTIIEENGLTVDDQRVVIVASSSGPQGAAGVGVPAGGSTGQVLAKASGTNYDTQWVTGGGGGGSGDVVGPASSVDGRAVLFDGTTGKLIKQANAAPMLVGDAPTSHAASHQDGGSDELALDASQLTSGTVATARLPGLHTVFPLVSAQYTRTADRTSASTLTNNRLYYAPIWINATTTFDRIAVNHEATTAGAGSVGRLGIYGDSSGVPGALVLDAGTIDLTTAAAFKTITISQQLTGNTLYWLAFVAQIASGSPTFGIGAPRILVTDSSSIGSGFKFEAQSGALPATATPGASNATGGPVIYLRAA